MTIVKKTLAILTIPLWLPIMVVLVTVLAVLAWTPSNEAW